MLNLISNFNSVAGGGDECKGGGGYPLLDPTRVTVDQATLLVQVCRPSCNTPQSSVFCPADPSLGGEDWKKEQALIV